MAQMDWRCRPTRCLNNLPENMSLLPLDWVVVDAPSNRTEPQINGSFGRVLWVENGDAVLRLVGEGGVPGDA
jgi:hypothetical protein